MSHPTTARLFAAIDPPAAVCDQLAAWAREVSAALRAARVGPADAAKVRLLAPETMHVTLCFLGSRPAAEIDVLASALEGCPAGEVGEVSIGAPLWLPPREPRTLSLEVGDPDGRLGVLQSAVTEAFAQAVEWEPERRRFRPHLTVARIGRGGKPSRHPSQRGRRRGERHDSGRPPEASAPILPATPQLSFTPSALVLYRSWLDPAGARYEALATRELTSSSSSPSSSSSSPEEGEEGAGEP